MIQLIATPERYDGKKVSVYGYLHLQFENTALYLSKEDSKYGGNALWVSFSKDLKLETTGNRITKKRPKLSHYDCRHVLVEGVFDSSMKGHMGNFPGEISNITRIVELKRFPLWKRMLLRTVPRSD